MSRRDLDDDDADDRSRRRRRDEHGEDDYDDRQRPAGGRSGSVTGVAVYGIVLGSLDLLLGICMLIGVMAAGGEAGGRGAFQIPGLGSAFAIVIIVTLLILAWGVLAIAGSIGVINRTSTGRIIIFVVAAIGGAFGLLALFGAVMTLAAPADPFGAAGGAKALAFLINFVIAGLFISYCVWAMVALIKYGHEFR